MSPITNLHKGAALLGVFALCFLLELRYPLRKQTQPKLKRTLVNISIAGVSAILMRIIFYPAVLWLSEVTELQHWGLIPRMNLPILFQTFVSLIVLDYTFYLWHQFLHKIPFLWRFHNVHHIDLDLDTSTALRFHFGELMISTLYRSAQIFIFGINVFTLIIFETGVTAFALFHHSNLRIPLSLERLLSYLIITPRIHGIHHSIIRNETDSNFGTILTIWDRLHRTLRLNINQKEITIGVPSYRNPREQNFIQSLLAPFEKQRAWKLPDESIPERQLKRKESMLLLP